jgi:hypothetical protein
MSNRPESVWENWQANPRKRPNRNHYWKPCVGEGVFMNEFLLLAVVMIYVAICYSRV